MTPHHATTRSFRVRLRSRSRAIAGILGVAWLALAGSGVPAARANSASGAFGSFQTSILPLLTKAGCNAGACHGAATGQGGFRLSLLGYDPDEDHDRITREFGQRRIDPAQPEQSLLLLKASHAMDHEGGRRFPKSGAAYRAMRDWIAAGAPRGPRSLEVVAIRVEPAEVLNARPGVPLPLRVLATRSDGVIEEVTSVALFHSNDDAVAEVVPSGLVTPRAAGLGSIMVRHGGQVAAVRLGIPYSEPIRPDAASGLEAAFQREAGLLGVPLSPPADPAEFLRRVHLDLTGRLPSAAAARDFLARPDSAALRQGVIDELLGGDAFTDFWTLQLADLLQIGPRRSQADAARTWHAWLRQQIARDAPLNQLASDLITAEGDAMLEGPPNFPLLASDPRDLAEHVGRMFLGLQIGCARCHAHPTDRWTQDDYHRFAAYFARMTRDGSVVRSIDHGEVPHPKSGQALAPRPLGGPPPPAAALVPGPSDTRDRRGELGSWVKDSPLFARAFANRVCHALLGRAPVEPVDDFRPTNPPTHPSLLDRLERAFAEDGYRLRPLIREIVRTPTYQRSSRALPGNAFDHRLYSHAAVKPLSAEVFLDAVAQVTEIPEVFPGQAEGTRAVQLVGPLVPSPALDLLGRCSRERRCDVAAAGAGGGLAQALHLINGPTVNARLRGGLLAALAARRATDADIVEELHLRAFARLPRPDERAEWTRLLATAPDHVQAVEDLLWTILNSREFAMNH